MNKILFLAIILPLFASSLEVQEKSNYQLYLGIDLALVNYSKHK